MVFEFASIARVLEMDFRAFNAGCFGDTTCERAAAITSSWRCDFEGQPVEFYCVDVKIIETFGAQRFDKMMEKSSCFTRSLMCNLTSRHCRQAVRRVSRVRQLHGEAVEQIR